MSDENSNPPPTPTVGQVSRLSDAGQGTGHASVPERQHVDCDHGPYRSLRYRTSDGQREAYFAAFRSVVAQSFCTFPTRAQTTVSVALKPWASECAMLSSFMSQARARGFSTRPESCGHDVVLRLENELGQADGLGSGDTVAVQAKRQPTMRVLAQAIPPDPDRHSANWYAVLVPRMSEDFRVVARAVGVVVIAAGERDFTVFWDENLRRDPLIPLDLPPVVDVPAGVPGPRSITRWKCNAVRVCINALESPHREIESGELRRLGLDQRLFLRQGWIEPVRGRGGKVVYRLTETKSRPDLRYPEVAEAVRRY